MNGNLWWVGVLALAAGASPALAEEAAQAAPPPAGEAKRADRGVAVVDYQRALNAVCEGRAEKAALKKEFADKQLIIDAEKSSLERESASLSDDEAKRRMGELQKLFDRFQKELGDHEREAVRRIYDHIEVVARELERDEGYASVVEKGKAGSQATAGDVTGPLIARYERKFPVAGCAPATGVK